MDSKGFPVGEGSDPKGVQIETSLSNLRLNTSLPPKTFAFVPPKDAKPMEEAVNLEMQNAMLQVGQKAPLFEVRNPLGGTISLAELLKENRAVMVNFWSTGCAACLVEFRKLQKLNEEMQGKGFVLIALNSFDDPDSVRKFLKQNGYTFTVGLSGANGGKKESVDDLFKAQAYPSNYLVGQNGNILWRNFGYEEAEVRQVLEKVGIK